MISTYELTSLKVFILGLVIGVVLARARSKKPVTTHIQNLKFGTFEVSEKCNLEIPKT